MWCMGYKPVSCHVWLVLLGNFINSDLSFFWSLHVMSQLMSSFSATLSKYGVTISHFAFSCLAVSSFTDMKWYNLIRNNCII